MMSVRPLCESDRAAFAAMNADPHVMRFMPATLSVAESDAFFDRIVAHGVEHGFTLKAIADGASGEFAGFCGLLRPSFEAKFTPCVEIGWRVRSEFQNRGWATMAARQELEEAFTALHLAEVVSFTVPQNLASRRVMEKLGMVHSPQEDFEHPRLPPGHPLRPHVLYRLTRESWLTGQKPKPNETP